MFLPPSFDEYSDEYKELIKKLWLRTTIDIVTGCYLYAGVNQRGHGQLRYQGRSHGVHRLSAMIFLGLDLSDSKAQANHTCVSKNCWFHEHLYIGTQSENIKDAVTYGTYNNQNTLKTHCMRGHLLEGDNLNLAKDGGRRCRQCKKEYDEERRFRLYGSLSRNTNENNNNTAGE